MPRTARVKVEGEDAWYHIYSRVHGGRAEKCYPLGEPELQRKMIRILRRFSEAYCCSLASYCIMGNHWHAILHFEAPRELASPELSKRARLLYPGVAGKGILDTWEEADWERFKARLFNLSEFMRNVNAAFTRWYNHNHKTIGTFWADRFKSVVLTNERAVLDCMLYIELNPVRAGIVERPEDFEGSSAFLRNIGKAQELAPLSEVLDQPDARQAARDYRGMLYYRGNVPTREGQARIPDRLVKEEEARGFKQRGTFLKRLRYMRDGAVMGTREQVGVYLEELRKRGKYLRRKNPIPQGDADAGHYTLREQRSHAVI